MNQHETAWFRKIIFLSITILAMVLTMARSKPAYAQVAPASFDAVDDCFAIHLECLHRFVLLVTLPSAFGAKMSVILLFQPDVGWVAVISGVFANVWGILRTGIVILALRQTFERQKKFQPSCFAI